LSYSRDRKRGAAGRFFTPLGRIIGRSGPESPNAGSVADWPGSTAGPRGGPPVMAAGRAKRRRAASFRARLGKAGVSPEAWTSWAMFSIGEGDGALRHGKKFLLRPPFAPKGTAAGLLLECGYGNARGGRRQSRGEPADRPHGKNWASRLGGGRAGRREPEKKDKRGPAASPGAGLPRAPPRPWRFEERQWAESAWRERAEQAGARHHHRGPPPTRRDGDLASGRRGAGGRGFEGF